MVEFIANFEARDLGVFAAPFLLLFFSGLAGIRVLVDRRKQAKRVEMPHTMSDDEYTRLNQKRFGGDSPSGGHRKLGGPGGA